MKTFSEFLMEIDTKDFAHPFCEFVKHCKLKESTIYGEVSICKEFVENFKKLSFELNSILKYNMYPRKYVVMIPNENSSSEALKFINDYLNLIKSAISLKNSFSDQDWVTPELLADAKTFNIYIDLLNISIKQFSKILNSGGEDCIKRDIVNKDVDSIFKGEFVLTPINTNGVLTTFDVLQPKPNHP